MAKFSIATKEILLLLLAGGGAIALTIAFATMPGLALGLGPFMKNDYRDRKRLQQSLYYLKRRQYISLTQKEGKSVVSLTRAGKSYALAYQIDTMIIPVPQRWDNLWRLVIFDVPAKKKVARDTFRQRLKLLGMYQLQESVWIHPYPCAEQIEVFAELYEVAPFVKVLTVTELPERDKKNLISLFGLAQDKD